MMGGSDKKTRISLTLTKPYLDALNHIVEEGVYLSQGEAVREGLRLIFRHYGIEPFLRPLEEKGEQ
jgi:Arc/MetJ-type ribon-helix-helix transcriptional regulator